MIRAKTNGELACILFVALLITSLIAFGATQNETLQNVTQPENIITSEHVAELNETPSEDNTGVTAPIQPLQTPENATDNTTGNATGVTLQTPENATDNTTGNATGISIQAPENVTDNTTVIGLNYTINESTCESRNINVTESVIGTPKLNANKESFSLDEVPTFSFEYKTFRKSFIKNASQKTFKNVTENASRGMFSSLSEEAAEAATGAPQKALKKWVIENETVETCVYDSSGALTDLAPEIAKTGEGKFVIKLPKARAFRAGVYTLNVRLVKDEHIYVLESEFPWGLVSVNTRKSIYKPGETAEFVIVVLDKAGHSVKNADISLTVNNPNNDKTTYSTADGTITASSECGIYNLDYHTEVEGNHSVSVTGLIDNVEVSFDTYFRVLQAYEFDLVRTTQSKIDPTLQDRFEVRIDVESLTDADSVTLKEFVPAEFCVYPTDAAMVMQEGDTKTITWHKELTDKKTSVCYSYAVPPVWPYLYALGPAEISHGTETFTEARPWYVAVDPISIINVQSYPSVGGNWTVKFEIVGTADLTITTVDGTTWTNQPYECYDAETEVLTKEGWKLFKDLDAEEEVLTLNPETKAQEWQKPVKYMEYDYSDAMFEITLADGSQLLVSPEHKVYGLMRDKSSVVSATNRTHTNPICLSFSNLPFLISLPSLTSSSSLNCLASFITSSMNRESNLRFSSNDISSSISRSILLTSPLSNPGTSTTNSDISIASNYKTGLLYLNTYSLLKISDLLELPDKQLVSLNSELNPVAVKKIEEVPYTGKIYDVDAPNDLVRVKQHNETTRKPQITQDHTKLFCKQKPIKYLEYDYSDAMFEITLADGTQLLVSPEHTVYGAMVDRKKNLLIGFIMVNQSVKDDGILFNPEKQNKASDLDSLVITHISPEIFEVVNRKPIKSSDLVYLILNTPEQGGIRSLESFQCSGEFIGRDNLHKSSHQLLNSSKVMVFLLPDLSSFNTTSVDLTTSLANDSLTSRLSSAGISDICAAALANSSSSISSNLSDMAFATTEDQLTQPILDIFSFIFSGILTTNSVTSTTNNNIRTGYLNNFVSLRNGIDKEMKL